MKIRYFSIIAEQAFVTAPSGERLFYCGLDGLWSRPYLIPDEATEKRLYQKQLWMVRISLSAMFLGMFSFFIARPNFWLTATGYLFYLLFFAIFLLTYGFVNWLVFRWDVASLRRVDRPVPLRIVLADVALRGSWPLLMLRVCGSVAFVIVGIWIVALDNYLTDIAFPSGMVLAGWVTIILFGLMTILSGYTLYLKLKLRRRGARQD